MKNISHNSIANPETHSGNYTVFPAGKYAWLLMLFLALPAWLSAQVNISSVSFPKNNTLNLKKICSGAACDGDCVWTSAELSFELTVSPAHTDDTIKKIVITAPNGVSSTLFSGSTTEAVVKDIKVPNKFLTCPSTDTWTYTVSVEYKIASSEEIISHGKESFIYHFACEYCENGDQKSVKTTGNGQTFVRESPLDQWITIQFSLLNFSPKGGMDLILPRLRFLQPFEWVQHLEPVFLPGGGDTTMLIPVLIPAGTPACTAYRIILEAGYESGDGLPGMDMVSIAVTPIDAPIATSTVNPVSCFGLSDGAAVVTLSDETLPYKIIWENGQNGPFIAGLSAGVYCARIIDEKECTVQNICVPVPEPAELLLTNDHIAGATAGQANGAVQMTVSGGTPPYFFNWKNEKGDIIAETEDLEGVSSGTYTLEMKDANGCTNLPNTYFVPSLVRTHGLSMESGIQVYPNPTAGRLSVELPVVPDEVPVISLIDITGRAQAPFVFFSNGRNRWELDMGNLPAGVYLMRVSFLGREFMERIVLNR